MTSVSATPPVRPAATATGAPREALKLNIAGLELTITSPHCGCLLFFPSFCYLHQGEPALPLREGNFH